MAGGPFSEILEQRHRSAQARLVELSEHLSKLESVNDVEDLCIYVTGSFGRLEASSHSDLDLFFVQTGSARISKIEKSLLDADVVRAARQLGFPEFSRDGLFLEVHNLDDVLSNLGGQQDDAKNYFTARLLLLLESRPVVREDLYKQALTQIIEAYYRDYQDHEKDFLPVFLTNEIVRFWKTLCLNYEHRRNRRSTDEHVRAKSHLKNLKLKFSRMATCYSTLAWIARQPTGPGPGLLFEMLELTPTQRLISTANFDAAAEQMVRRAIAEYDWFLKATAYSEDDLLNWIKDPARRDEAFDHARSFGEQIFRLLLRLSDGKPFLRYLVV